jgi:hypothetical protein
MPTATTGAFTTTNQFVEDKLICDATVIASIDPGKPQEQVTALWDTGAQHTVIDEDLAKRLGMSPVQVVKILTPSNIMDAKVYVLDLILSNQITITHVNAIGAYPGACDVLIGMDVIGLGDFAVTNYLNQTSFTFRIPSKERIDFTRP